MHLNLILSLALTLPGTPLELSQAPIAPTLLQSCTVPIPWRIGAVDERFGVSSEEVADAARTAAMLWGEVLGGRLLFAEDRSEGSGPMEIRLLFDERAELARGRRERERFLTEESLRIAESRAALDSVRADLEIFRERQGEANRTYLERMSEYNRLVAALNSAGGVSIDMNARLSEMASALDEEQGQIETLTAEFNEAVARVNASAELLNSEVAAYNAARIAFQSDFGETGVAPATYHETRRELGPFTTSITRAIEVYHFENRNDLVLLFAREMGQALGLPLSSVPLSVMSGTATRDGRPALHSTDIEALRSHCSER